MVIGILILGLSYLGLAPEDEVSVPEGAQAGDLAELESCSVKTDEGSLDAECGSLVVPESRADPESRLIALPVTRIKAASDDPDGPVFRLQGGPGITNTEFPEANRIAENHDVVLVGYRGVDGSADTDCPEVASALKRADDMLDEESLSAYSDAFAECAERLQEEGYDLSGYTVPERVEDLEAARVALGYDRINLLSESAGTRYAMGYAWEHPQNVNRSVMIGVNPPGHFIWDPETTDELLRRYGDLCAEDAACSERTDDLTATVESTAADMPESWMFLPIAPGTTRLASFFGLMESTTEATPLTAPSTLDTYLAAAEGDPSGLWFQSLLAELAFPEAFTWGEMAGIASSDDRVAGEYFASGGDPGSILGNPGTEFIWGGGGLVDAWPSNGSENKYGQAQRSDVETLLIGGTLDFATPVKHATDELLPKLPNGDQVVLSELGHTTDFWSYDPDASTRLLNTYFDTGEVDDSGYDDRTMDFEPRVTNTALAKGLFWGFVGFAVIALFSLVLMWRRVRGRGGFGSKGGGALRSIFTLVLGFGGWFLAVLIVLTVWPTLPLDHPALAVLPIGVPIGLGVYLAWVNRDWSTGFKRAGFWMAMVGALAGAALGFYAGTGLLALITSIVGAAIGANLPLILRDISWDRSGRDRFAGARPAEAS